MIVMLPKPDRAPTDPGSYRPLSMMGVDTISSKAVANRLNTVVPSLVHEDQCGFVAGRVTHMNLRRLTHVQRSTDGVDNAGDLVALDI